MAAGSGQAAAHQPGRRRAPGCAAIDRDEARPARRRRPNCGNGGRRPCRGALRHFEPRKQRRCGFGGDRRIAGPLRRAGQRRGGAASGRARRRCRWRNGARCLLSVNLTGYFPCARRTFGRQMRNPRAAADLDPRRPRSPAAQCRRATAAPTASARRASVCAVAPARGAEWGPPGHPQRCRQPRHGDHADEPVVLRHAGGDRAARSAVVPTRRVGMPQDIAEAILFLAGDRSSMSTARRSSVDGGYAQHADGPGAAARLSMATQESSRAGACNCSAGR